LGSSLALINGQRVFLEHPAFLKDDLLYLPVDFYEYHMNCFDYTHASALAANVLTFDPGVTPAFTTVPDEGSLSVSVESLPQPPVVEGGTEGTPQVPSTTF